MDVQKTIQAVINTMNQIQVSGEGNLDKLLGCILALKQANEFLSQPPEIKVVELEPSEQPKPE